ncbi:sodium/potassium/calcium exchanger 3-like [Cylas formicarius]|uniref:sodium/potassium/calcium exchanger 3-like n=1 Tax=Cylas formicarius TaxID=197179 RepID=UPI002958D244|nr:sodium/potassium/calcium exchanger 3-like [Cylas formicarius]XP_060518278.1 sodium/potassium/calcium exchanger 3-like [Cylas formicarius]
MKRGIIVFLLYFVLSTGLRLPGLIDSARRNDIAQKNIKSDTDYVIRRSLSSSSRLSEDTADNETCGGDDDDDDFPSFLTNDQVKQGGIVLCFVVAIYCFSLLAVVCDKYFLPSIERLCEVMDLSADVAAATFMSVATSCPELFTNIIATFVTGSELGIGTIVGSSMFNSLGVASVGSLAASVPIQLDWWPVTRDVCVYMLSITLLIVIVWDGFIFWYEGLALFIAYFVYFAIMFQNPRISRWVRNIAAKYQAKKVDDVVDVKYAHEQRTLSNDQVRVSVLSAYGSYVKEVREAGYENTEAYKRGVQAEKEYQERENKKSPFAIPAGGFWTKFCFFYTWPIKMVLRCTIPNPKIHPKLFPLSFIICIFWIGGNSYMVSWMITLIGTALNIPSTVQGLTFSAAGSSLPESLSIAIMSRRGEGKMGVSNSLGANSMNILFSLGMPWFFKTILKGTNNDAFIEIHSGSIVYTIMALIVVALILYATLFFNNFRLARKTGYVLVTVYAICIVLACLNEMVFFPPKC